MWFWKKRKGKAVYRYSIGEKLAYYKSQLNSEDPNKRKWAQKSIKRLEKEINKFGNVLMVHDKEFNPRANDKKSRRVVCVGVENGKMKVVAIRKNKKMVSLSKFDGNRGININHIHNVDLNHVYEKRTFSKTTNDYLTSHEKLELQRKLNDNR